MRSGWHLSHPGETVFTTQPPGYGLAVFVAQSIHTAMALADEPSLMKNGSETAAAHAARELQHRSWREDLCGIGNEVRVRAFLKDDVRPLPGIIRQ